MLYCEFNSRLYKITAISKRTMGNTTLLLYICIEWRGSVQYTSSAKLSYVYCCNLYLLIHKCKINMPYFTASSLFL